MRHVPQVPKPDTKPAQNGKSSELQPDTVTTEAPLFDAMLSPQRSLSPKGFLILMSVISVVSFGCGLYFYALGAWPVLGFFGLDVLVIYCAFRWNYRDARMQERIVIYGDKLVVSRRTPAGKSESWTFNPYWARVEITQVTHTAQDLRLISHGRYLSFGRFLNDDEKSDFADVLSRALRRYRSNTDVNA